MIPGKKLRKTESTEELVAQKNEILHRLEQHSSLIHGSLYTVKVKCGKPNCRCATGEGHVTYYIASHNQDRRTTDYVSRKMVDTLQHSLQDDISMQADLDMLSEINLELFRRHEL